MREPVTPTAGDRPATPAGSQDRVRLHAALASVGLTALCSLAGSWPANPGGWTAVLVILANLGLLGGHTLRTGDRPTRALLAAAAVVGAVELLADFLCVRCTGTLDYSPAHSWVVLASPWWMPGLWTVVAAQIGIVGDAVIRRFGFVRGTALGALLGGSLIPWYEELAWGAHWWRYRNCLQVGHVPVYIVAAEGIIGAGLSVLGYGALRTRPARAALLGVPAGLVTILGGTIGWGLVEFLCRGARPGWGLP